MNELYEALRVLQLFVFGGLGLVAVLHWRRRRDEITAWLAASFCVLAVVVLAARFVPESDSALSEWIQRTQIAVLALFPYSLWRFHLTFITPVRWFWIVAHVLTALAVGGIFLVPDLADEGEARGLWFQVYVYLLLIDWVLLTGRVAFRLWKSGATEPAVARRRMRMLSLATIGLAVALLLAGLAPSSEDVNLVQLTVQLLAIASGPLFLLGFAPPQLVRAWWRQPAEAELREAELALMEARGKRDVADALLPHVAHLVGGRGSFLLDADEKLIGCDQLSEHAAAEMLEKISPKRDRPEPVKVDEMTVLMVPMRSGWLGVLTTSFTPFFGQDELALLRHLAVLVDLALARIDLLDRERQAHDQLQEAEEIAHLGSWEWDLGTNTVRWSDELYRIFGLHPERFVPSYESYLGLVHPEDRPSVERSIQKALDDKLPFTYESRLTRQDGSTRTVLARGKVLSGPDGHAVRMIGTAQDISDRKKQEAFREQFIANAAHELRTPLTTLLGFTKALFRTWDRMTPEQVDDAFAAVNRAGERLTVLVNNLLDLSKWQEGEIRLEPEPVPLASLSRTIVEETPPPDDKTVDVRITDEVVALADPHRLRQVLSNLLINAYRYGGSEVVVGASSRNGNIVIEVSDNGPGVEPQLIGDLFDPFVRGQTAVRAGGSGLGLAIVKMLVEASGGDVWYERANAGGARFCVRLPTGW